jgi:hypothetical protein
LEFLQDSLDEVGKGRLLVLVGVPDVLREDGDGFGIGLRLKLIAIPRSEPQSRLGNQEYPPPLLQNETKLARIGDDTVVNDGELVAMVTKRLDGIDRVNNWCCGVALDKFQIASRVYETDCSQW